jgi:hypothetical protein
MLAVTLTEPGKVKVAARLNCPKAAAAFAIKGVTEKTLADVKSTLKEERKRPLPPEHEKANADMKKMFVSLSAIVNGVAVSSADNTVVVGVEMEPADAVNALRLLFRFLAIGRQAS